MASRPVPRESEVTSGASTSARTSASWNPRNIDLSEVHTLIHAGGGLIGIHAAHCIAWRNQRLGLVGRRTRSRRHGLGHLISGFDLHAFRSIHLNVGTVARRTQREGNQVLRGLDGNGFGFFGHIALAHRGWTDPLPCRQRTRHPHVRLLATAFSAVCVSSLEASLCAVSPQHHDRPCRGRSPGESPPREQHRSSTARRRPCGPRPAPARAVWRVPPAPPAHVCVRRRHASSPWHGIWRPSAPTPRPAWTARTPNASTAASNEAGISANSGLKCNANAQTSTTTVIVSNETAMARLLRTAA